MIAIAIINGPNLNLLGQRETHHYGNNTLEEINQGLLEAFKNQVKLEFFQSNHEGNIIDYLQNQRDKDGIVINPGAFTHTSVAIRDTLSALNLPTVEVHLSNIYKREQFRKASYFSDIAIGIISGFGGQGYHFAVKALVEQLKR
jgi:3-dehydroquinate dehydratase II